MPVGVLDRILLSAAALGVFCGCNGATLKVSDGGADGVSTLPECTAAPQLLAPPLWRQPASAGLPPSAATTWTAGDLAVNRDWVYVAAGGQDDGRIWRVPIRGGANATVAAIGGAEIRMMLTSVDLILARTRLVSAAVVDELAVVPLAGGEPNVLMTAKGDLVGLAADGQAIFASDSGSGTWRVDRSGAATSIDAHVGELVVAGDQVIIADAKDGLLLSTSGGGGAVQTLASGQSRITQPMVCGDGICWMTSGNEHVPSSVAAIMQLLPGGTPTPLSQNNGLFNAARTAFDGSAFFISIVGDGTFEGPVEEVPAAGGAPTLFAGAVTYGLAVDDSCVFWADTEHGVFSVAK